MMEIREVERCGRVVEELLAMSADWEAEDSCRGYVRNSEKSLEGTLVFVAEEESGIIGYLFGRMMEAKNSSSVMPDGTACFEVEEIYVRPGRRSQGVGSALFRFAEERVRPEAAYLTLSTATKNFRAILHFYAEELGMEFWSARLFKKL